MDPKNYRVVLAVFCDSQFDVRVLEHALKAAKESGAKLEILDVRHRQMVGNLSELLSSQGILGRRTVEKLKRNVLDQRDQLIRRYLGEMKNRAEAEGLTAEVHEERGDFYEVVTRVVERAGADVIVIEEDHHEDLELPIDVLRV